MSHFLGVLLYFGQTNRIKRSVKSNLIPLASNRRLPCRPDLVGAVYIAMRYLAVSTFPELLG